MMVVCGSDLAILSGCARGMPSDINLLRQCKAVARSHRYGRCGQHTEYTTIRIVEDTVLQGHVRVVSGHKHPRRRTC
jgi:hypothetical protein